MIILVFLNQVTVFPQVNTPLFLSKLCPKVSPFRGDLRILGARLSWFSEKSMNGYEVDVRNFVCSIYFDGC